MTTTTVTPTGQCDTCQRPIIPGSRWDRLPPSQRDTARAAGCLRAGNGTKCGSCYNRSRRGTNRLDDSTLATLRRAVGIPPQGPTAEMIAAWRAAEGDDEGGES